MPDRNSPKASLLSVCLLLPFFSPMPFYGQTSEAGSAITQQPQSDLASKINQLSDAIAHEQEQLKQSQQRLDLMMQQLQLLRQQMTQQNSTGVPQPAPETAPAVTAQQSESASSTADVRELAEQQQIQQSEIATHEQTKVESASKYPVRLSGLILLNGFVNSSAVDIPATPTLALTGSGTTGLTLSQTMLGIEASGPHLWGAHSYANLQVDFFGTSNNSTTPYSGYLSNNTLLRLKTAHAGLQWDNGELYFALDRPLISPDSPSSLTAVAEPLLAWSGNLWTWNPQIGAVYNQRLSDNYSLRFEAAVVDVGDAPYAAAVPEGYTTTSGSTGELSRRPGVMGRVAFLGQDSESGRDHFGVGGYFAPHHTAGQDFDSWAASLDAGLHLGHNIEFLSSAYRGEALGGLGGGAYKDFLSYVGPVSGNLYFRPLDDVGGWAQLKERIGAVLEFNQAFGIDNGFSHEIRRYTPDSTNIYAGIARNHVFTSNVIYSPKSYLQFSVEYRRLNTFTVYSPGAVANIAGWAAGYRF